MVEQDITEKASNATQYSGAGLAILSGLTLNEFGVIIGIILGIGGFLVNWYYKHQAYKLAKKNAVDPIELLKDE